MHCTLSPLHHLPSSYDFIPDFVSLHDVQQWSSRSSLGHSPASSPEVLLVRVSAPLVIAGEMIVPMIFLYRQIGILLSFKKWPYSPNGRHPDIIIRSLSLLISLLDVINRPNYSYSVTSSKCSASIISPLLCLLLATSLHMTLVFFYSVSFHLSFLCCSDFPAYLSVSLHFQQTCGILCTKHIILTWLLWVTVVPRGRESNKEPAQLHCPSAAREAANLSPDNGNIYQWW